MPYASHTLKAMPDGVRVLFGVVVAHMYVSRISIFGYVTRFHREMALLGISFNV